ncbi:g6355 [Coccomyxa elongata]
MKQAAFLECGGEDSGEKRQKRSSGGRGCLAAGLPLYAGKAGAAVGSGGGLTSGERHKLKAGLYGVVVRFLATGVH